MGCAMRCDADRLISEDMGRCRASSYVMIDTLSMKTPKMALFCLLVSSDFGPNYYSRGGKSQMVTNQESNSANLFQCNPLCSLSLSYDSSQRNCF